MWYLNFSVAVSGAKRWVIEWCNVLILWLWLCVSGDCVSDFMFVKKIPAELPPDRSIGTTTMFRMLHNYPVQRYVRNKASTVLKSSKCDFRDAGIPINTLPYRPGLTTSSASSSPSGNHIKISVHTTSDGFSDESTQKEGLWGVRMTQTCTLVYPLFRGDVVSIMGKSVFGAIPTHYWVTQIRVHTHVSLRPFTRGDYIISLVRFPVFPPHVLLPVC
jgi:hypothetical protein